MAGMGMRVREIRRKKNIDAAELARAIGVSESTILKIEVGDRGKKCGLVPRLAKALGCRTDDLFPEMDEPVLEKSASAGAFEETREDEEDEGIDWLVV